MDKKEYNKNLEGVSDEVNETIIRWASKVGSNTVGEIEIGEKDEEWRDG